MYNIEKYQTLKKELDPELYGEIALRIHRANSWLSLANNYNNDDDQFYIFSWIAFNALYNKDDKNIERERYKDFFKTLLSINEKKLYDILWKEYADSARVLLNSQYCFSPFWEYEKGRKDYADWKQWLDASIKKANKALTANDTLTVLTILFDRMYFLRNQILHGSATYGSNLNRDQLKSSSKLIKAILPVCIESILAHPDKNWGEVTYRPKK